MMETDRKNIIWLASYPKSGNTWFRVFLANLLSSGDKPVSINELNAGSIASSRQLLDDYTGVEGSDLTIEEIEELRPAIYKKIAEESEEPVFLKVHDTWRKTPSGKSMFPPSVSRAVLYFIRDPRDVLVSFAHHNNKSIGQTTHLLNSASNAFCARTDRIYNQVLQPLSDWSGHVTSWTGQQELPVHMMRYEDMLDDPFTSFKQALDFIGLHFETAMIEKAIASSNIEKLREMEAKEGFREKPISMDSFFREGRKGNWGKHLSDSDVVSVINRHADVMKRYGYLT